MMRSLLVALPFVALLGCSSPPTATAASGTLPGVSDRVRPGSACVAEMQPCTLHADCCSGMVCENTGRRYGKLCARPYPS